ncbi:MAG: spore coat protein CotJB [Clostridia bacterium]|nr:spore coat protein CotJB [Clostridia bacterium]
MLSEKAKLRRYIMALDFAIHELVLFLDSHRNNQKALRLFDAYRATRDEKIGEYERKYGDLIITAESVPPSTTWKWLDGPWPWENNFLEEE